MSAARDFAEYPLPSPAPSGTDDGRVILKVGAAGGSVTLFARSMGNGELQFARRTVDHTAELVGKPNVVDVERPPLEWVDSWDEGLRLLDRYPWVRLHPMEVHPEFVGQVRAAVEVRLALVSDPRERKRAREKWGRVLNAAESTAA